jgi:tetrahydromethanopterin S-methyltransferase subunit A
MPLDNVLNVILKELAAGMQLPKCWKCGCMNDALAGIDTALISLEGIEKEELHSQMGRWQQQMQPTQYTCLGCPHCFPAVATNHMNQAYPEAMNGQALACDFEIREQEWPTVPGEYHHFCMGADCPVAVSTLASQELAEKLAHIQPPELCIVGKTETENIGIDKVIKNTITNPTIRFLVLAGQDPQGHYPGQTLLSLWENGVDEKMRIIGSKGKRPVLRNVSRAEVDQFRQQVQVVDLIGCEDVETIVRKIEEVAQQPLPSTTTCCCTNCQSETSDTLPSVPVVDAAEPSQIELDKAGYFVIIPQPTDMNILVEHYNYDNQLLRVIRGENARKIYWTIIENEWVSLLSHAAYLGKELNKAELSLTEGFKYIQDGA